MNPPHAYILYINIIYNYILYINITTKREATRKRPITFFDVFDIFDTLTSNHQSLRRFLLLPNQIHADMKTKNEVEMKIFRFFSLYLWVFYVYPIESIQNDD